MSESPLLSLCHELNQVLREDEHANYVHSLQTVSAQIPNVTRAVSETVTVEPKVYGELVSAFLSLKDDTFGRTLLGDDYIAGPYWYEPIGAGRIIDSDQPIPLRLERPLAGLKYKRASKAGPGQENLLASWLQTLQAGFPGCGSTMWITQRHKHKAAEGEIDTSAVFIVFNAPIKNKNILYRLAKASRDALVQRLLTDYSKQAALDMGILARILGEAEVSAHCGKLVEEKLRRNADAFASNYPVLISGEPGTGKMTVAEAIHYIRESVPKRRANSKRTNPAFCTISGQDLGSTRSQALENILRACSYHSTRGDAKGKRAMLLESDQGTIVFDNVHEASAPAQATLLDLLEYKLFGLERDRDDLFPIRRAIFIGPPGLSLAARLERFSPSLLATISPFEISVPSLRERRDEIEDIAKAATMRLAPVLGLSPEVELPTTAVEFIKEHDWGGNLRDLYGYVAQVLIAIEKRIE